MQKLNTPPESIISQLEYDPLSGVFTWVESGEEAGAVTLSGYIQISYKSKLYYAHRLAFLFMEGSMPEKFVDHRNGLRSDNRWENLRHCDYLGNAQNIAPRARTKRGLMTGVSVNGSGFIAQIKFNGKNHYLGQFGNEADAHMAYVEAKSKIHSFQPTIRPSRAEVKSGKRVPKRKGE